MNDLQKGILLFDHQQRVDDCENDCGDMAAADEGGSLGSTVVQLVTPILLLCEVFSRVLTKFFLSFNNVAKKQLKQ